MKRLIVLCGFLAALMVAGMANADRIWWDAPTKYTDGSAVSPADQAKITYRLYVDTKEFASVQNGALEWNGTLPQKAGETKSYTATAEFPGQANTKSAMSAPYVFTYYLMLSPPGSLQIHLGQ